MTLADTVSARRTDPRQHFPDRLANHGIGEIVERRGLGVDDDDARPGACGDRNEAGDRIDLQARADGQQQIGLGRRIARDR